MASLVDSQKKDYEKQIKELKKKIVELEDKLAKYKIDFQAQSDKKIKDIIKASEDKLKVKIDKLNKIIEEERAKGKSKIEAAEKLYKDQVAFRQKEAEGEIRKLNGMIMKIKEASKEKEEKLYTQIKAEDKKSADYKKLIEAEKKTKTELKTELANYEKEQDKNLKDTLKVKATMTKKQIKDLEAKN